MAAAESTNSGMASRAVSRDAPLMVWEAKAGGLLDYFNPYVYRYSGASYSTLAGAHWINIVHTRDRARVLKRWSHSLATADPYEIDFRIRRRDGSYRWFAARAAVLHETGNRPVRWLGTCSEIDADGSHARQAGATLAEELQMQLWREDLGRVARRAILRESYARIAHELSQPLTAIMSNAQALQALLEQSAGLDPEARAMLADIVAEDRRAVELLRDVRAAFGEQLVSATCQDVNELVLKVVALHEPKMRLQNCTVSLKLGRNLPQVWVGRDHGLLPLIHVLANAFEATCDMPRNRRRISIRTERQTRDYVRITMSDSGPGMVESVAKAFEPFYSTKPSRLGLGLTVCRSMVEANGGRIGISSRSGRGVTVHIDLPCAARRSRPALSANRSTP